jgi:hypothetical protein
MHFPDAAIRLIALRGQDSWSWFVTSSTTVTAIGTEPDFCTEKSLLKQRAF